MDAADRSSIVPVAAPGASAGGSDPTRRWALSFPDGRERFAGIARTEGEAAIPALARIGSPAWDRALVAVELPVLLSQGAGPYLLDAEGRITLALGPHPHVLDARVAMGQPSPGHRIGLVAPAEGRVWTWLCDAVVDGPERVELLDALDAAADLGEAARWQERARRAREAR